MESATQSSQNGKCHWINQSQFCADVKHGTIAIVEALAAITIVGATLLILANQGYPLAGLNSLAATIGQQALFATLLIGGTILCVNTTLIIALIQNYQHKQYTLKELQKFGLYEKVKEQNLFELLPKNSFWKVTREEKNLDIPDFYALLTKDKQGHLSVYGYKNEKDRDLQIKKLGYTNGEQTLQNRLRKENVDLQFQLKPYEYYKHTITFENKPLYYIYFRKEAYSEDPSLSPSLLKISITNNNPPLFAVCSQAQESLPQFDTAKWVNVQDTKYSEAWIKNNVPEEKLKNFKTMCQKYKLDGTKKDYIYDTLHSDTNSSKIYVLAIQQESKREIHYFQTEKSRSAFIGNCGGRDKFTCTLQFNSQQYSQLPHEFSYKDLTGRLVFAVIGPNGEHLTFNSKKERAEYINSLPEHPQNEEKENQENSNPHLTPSQQKQQLNPSSGNLEPPPPTNMNGFADESSSIKKKLYNPVTRTVVEKDLKRKLTETNQCFKQNYYIKDRKVYTIIFNDFNFKVFDTDEERNQYISENNLKDRTNDIKKAQTLYLDLNQTYKNKTDPRAFWTVDVTPDVYKTHETVYLLYYKTNGRKLIGTQEAGKFFSERFDTREKREKFISRKLNNYFDHEKFECICDKIVEQQQLKELLESPNDYYMNTVTIRNVKCEIAIIRNKNGQLDYKYSRNQLKIEGNNCTDVIRNFNFNFNLFITSTGWTKESIENEVKNMLPNEYRFFKVVPTSLEANSQKIGLLMIKNEQGRVEYHFLKSEEELEKYDKSTLTDGYERHWRTYSFYKHALNSQAKLGNQSLYAVIKYPKQGAALLITSTPRGINTSQYCPLEKVEEVIKNLEIFKEFNFNLWEKRDFTKDEERNLRQNTRKLQQQYLGNPREKIKPSINEMSIKVEFLKIEGVYCVLIRHQDKNKSPSTESKFFKNEAKVKSYIQKECQNYTTEGIEVISSTPTKKQEPPSRTFFTNATKALADHLKNPVYYIQKLVNDEVLVYINTAQNEETSCLSILNENIENEVEDLKGLGYHEFTLKEWYEIPLTDEELQCLILQTEELMQKKPILNPQSFKIEKLDDMYVYCILVRHEDKNGEPDTRRLFYKIKDSAFISYSTAILKYYKMLSD